MKRTSNLKKELATYILKLHKAAQETKRAEDRQVYEKYLAGAAVILALAEEGSEKEMIVNEIQAHERLRGHTWLVDEDHNGSNNAWKRIKEVV